jgi:hypothetical protein
MKKYILDIASINIISLSDILTIKRTEQSPDKGITINSTFIEVEDWAEKTLPADYNDSNNYIRGRKVDVLPESSPSNTIITNDGLILVLMDANTAILVDMFEISDILYSDILETGYFSIGLYTNNINPLNRRLFLGSINNGLVTVSNDKIYSDSTNTYFVSQMDYNLPMNEDYYFEVLNSDWNNAYSLTSSFVLYKKQFFQFKLFIGGAEVPFTINSSDTFEPIGDTSFFRLKPIEMTSDRVTLSFSVDTSYNGQPCYLEAI